MNDDFSKLTSLLRRASREDRANLAKILDIEGADEPEQITYRFHELRAGVIGQFFSGYDYKQLVTDVADHVGVDWDGLLRGRPWERLATAKIEDAIVLKAFQRLYESLSEVDRRELAKELGNAAKDPNLVGQILTGGAMVLGRLSGMQIYIVATTAVGALTSALGITLPFVIYTGITRTIGAVLGPIGWVFLGVSVLFQINRPNWARLIPGIVYISYIRHKRAAKK
jgi:uncharacterized protein YaaW (UPF0174 family)